MTVLNEQPPPLREKALRWLSQLEDPAGMLYGAIISPAVLVASWDPHESAERVVIDTVVVLVIYWLAHVYIYTVSAQLRGDAHRLPRRLVMAARHESSVLVGGIPSIAAYVLALALGATSSSSASIALYVTVAVLLMVGYLSAHQAGLTRWNLAFETAGAGMFGVLMIAGQTLLH